VAPIEGYLRARRSLRRNDLLRIGPRGGMYGRGAGVAGAPTEPCIDRRHRRHLAKAFGCTVDDIAGLLTKS